MRRQRIMFAGVSALHMRAVSVCIRVHVTLVFARPSVLIRMGVRFRVHPRQTGAGNNAFTDQHLQFVGCEHSPLPQSAWGNVRVLSILYLCVSLRMPMHVYMPIDMRSLYSFLQYR